MKRKLLLVLLFGLLVAGVSCRHTLEPKTDLEKLTYKIEHLGGKVTLDNRNKVIVGVILTGEGVTDAALEPIRGLSTLESLDLGNSKVTDAGLECLKGLAKLQSLTLNNTQLSDAGLDQIKGLANLQLLDLWATKVTDGGLARLTGLSNLQSLNLRATEVGNPGMEHVAARRKPGGADPGGHEDRRRRSGIPQGPGQVADVARWASTPKSPTPD